MDYLVQKVSNKIINKFTGTKTFIFYFQIGKYSDFKHISEDVPPTNSPPTPNSNVVMDEITPLFNQTSISTTSDIAMTNGYSNHRSSKGHHHHHNATNNSNTSGSNNISGKQNSRKRFKTKSGRKFSSYNVPENNDLSDSDK